MPSHDGKRLAQIIKKSVDDFDITNRFKSSEPCIIQSHEALTSKTESEIISYDQSVNDFIIEQLDNSKTYAIIDVLMEFGMVASYITTNELGNVHIKHISQASMHAAVNNEIIGLKHNMIIFDDIESSKIIEPDILQFDFTKQENKQPKENHPHGWYRKFEKKRF